MRPVLARPPAGPGAGEASVDGDWVCSFDTLSPRCLASPLSIARRASEVLRPAPAAPSHSDQWTHPGIVNGGEAGRGELIVQAVVPAAVAGHADFQGVEGFPVLPERCLRAGAGVWQRISP